jgi:hypothetical protein
MSQSDTPRTPEAASPEKAPLAKAETATSAGVAKAVIPPEADEATPSSVATPTGPTIQLTRADPETHRPSATYRPADQPPSLRTLRELLLTKVGRIAAILGVVAIAFTLTRVISGPSETTEERVARIVGTYDGGGVGVHEIEKERIAEENRLIEDERTELAQQHIDTTSGQQETEAPIVEASRPAAEELYRDSSIIDQYISNYRNGVRFHGVLTNGLLVEGQNEPLYIGFVDPYIIGVHGSADGNVRAAAWDAARGEYASIVVGRVLDDGRYQFFDVHQPTGKVAERLWFAHPDKESGVFTFADKGTRDSDGYHLDRDSVTGQSLRSDVLISNDRREIMGIVDEANPMHTTEPGIFDRFSQHVQSLG